jgi:hypothetical protein
MAARRMAKVVLTTISPIEELAETCQRASDRRKSYVGSEPSSRGTFLTLELTIRDGDHEKMMILMEYSRARFCFFFLDLD